MKTKVVEKQAWSEKQDKKAKKAERKRKKDLKKEAVEEVIDTDEDEDNLEEDYRLLKKMKKVTQCVNQESNKVERHSTTNCTG